MVIVCVNDLHGHLPEVEPCDLLIIAGDIAQYYAFPMAMQQQIWYERDVRGWLDTIPAKNVVFVPGNHDVLWEDEPENVPALRWYPLIDEGIELDGFKIWGTPWQGAGLAFTRKPMERRFYFKQIPKDIDILVTHMPPFGICDGQNGKHYGDKYLRERIEEDKPKLVVCGHVHDGRGEQTLENGTHVVNATLTGRGYELKYKPIRVDLFEDGTRF